MMTLESWLVNLGFKHTTYSAQDYVSGVLEKNGYIVTNYRGFFISLSSNGGPFTFLMEENTFNKFKYAMKNCSNYIEPTVELRCGIYYFN